jgi:hypothetical protein
MKRLFWYSGVLALLTLAAMSTGCHFATHAQAGDYAYEMNGQTIEVAKVTQTDSGFDMQWYDDGKWLPVTEPVRVLSKADLGALVTGSVDKVEGLQSKEVTILFVPKGWTQVYLGHGGAENSEFKSATGFVWISPLGLIDLKKL